jgi:putative transposase
MSKSQTYPSDLTDEQWQVIRPLLPKRKMGKPGRPRRVEPRDLLDAIFYILRSSCPWRMLPHDFPPWGTVSSQFYRWRKAGLWEKIHDALRRKTRVAEGRNPLPRVGILDSQSVKTTEAGGPKGYDGGKKVRGRQRHVLVDTRGLLRAIVVTPANVQDYDGAKWVFDQVGRKYPRMKKIYADSIYVCNGLVSWLWCRWLRCLEIVKRPSGSKGFVLVAKRWIVERTLAWLSRCRRLSKDYERSVPVCEAWVRIAMIHPMARRLRPADRG